MKHHSSRSQHFINNSMTSNKPTLCIFLELEISPHMLAYLLFIQYLLSIILNLRIVMPNYLVLIEIETVFNLLSVNINL
jgi:hypothetical protein